MITWTSANPGTGLFAGKVETGARPSERKALTEETWSSTVAHFDRFDICAAWSLYLQHHWAGMGDPMYARWCKLRKNFTPAPSEEKVSGLSENALEIYATLCREAGTLEAPEHPIANAGDRGYDMRDKLFRMWAGEMRDTIVYVWADSFENAFEELVEWLDENAPGCLVSHEDALEALHEYQESCNFKDCDDESEVYEAVEQANDWTCIGHTSLKTGMHIRSDGWGGDEVETGSDEYERVLLAGMAS